jgi:8-oxo-dGTP diphosphatase
VTSRQEKDAGSGATAEQAEHAQASSVHGGADRPRIRVVAAEITNAQGHFLLTQRNMRAVFPLLWEFPGGRVRDGEPESAALMRCLRDKLGVDVAVGPVRLRVERDYQDYVVELQSYAATLQAGSPRALDVWDFRWVSVDEMKNYRFPPADKASVEALLSVALDCDSNDPA